MPKNVKTFAFNDPEGSSRFGAGDESSQNPDGNGKFADNPLENGPSDAECLKQKWFYLYPSASELRYQELRENHPDLDPVSQNSF